MRTGAFRSEAGIPCSLGRYITGTATDYSNARRIVNAFVLDQAASVADAATKFEVILRASLNQQPATLTMVLSSVTVKPTATQQFYVIAYDQFGEIYDPIPTITWATTVGTINERGKLTAPGSSATGTVTATIGTLRSSSAVTVSDSPALPWLTSMESPPFDFQGGKYAATRCPAY